MRSPVGRVGEAFRHGGSDLASMMPEFRCFVTVLHDSPVRRAIPRIDSFSRNAKLVVKEFEKLMQRALPLPAAPDLAAVPETVGRGVSLGCNGETISE